MRVLLWHVHGSWTDAFVRGRHEYLMPVLPEGGPWGGGRAGWDWPGVVEVPAAELADLDVDVVVLQRPEELALAERWLRRRPGRDVPAVYVEHNTPKGEVPNTRHPIADRDDICLVHVTHFNELMWDSGRAPTVVVEHGVADPGERYTGELERAAVVINEPVRRWRVTGTDLLPRFAAAGPVDVFGIGAEELPGRLGGDGALGDVGGRVRAAGNLRPRELHEQLARRRVYVHPVRWTSLGLSLIEAMHLGMPVVALATTEVVEAVPPGAGVISTRVDGLVDAVRELLADPAAAAALGRAARRAALDRYGLAPFLADWDRLLTITAARTARPASPTVPVTTGGSGS
ncbi:glycosyltransferase [Streptoalloteichus tenebrarius]|uniref:glycosyltransferase n=1 Tax=Streptoalloteichus tenebrarius (strain ATCC 17920 / DSM 40477 / JCM 4838 / CBS 697.72 / NBRC 16177 / NCIMB 11028 / NRRL B-12390 / A12253. 1 / ISP 5477) TaxID=1933 RepID=UPI0020A47C91|nr:glycosyltransferase [Streptoalloteichus tenebrarius]